MKKFFDRLRRWLIKKLGGYTEQFTPVRNEITRRLDVEAKKVQVQMLVTPSVRNGTINFAEYQKSRAIELIARFLDENGYIKWERREDIAGCLFVLRATLYAVSMEDLEPSYRERVETHGD